jgi:hypothetical protein
MYVEVYILKRIKLLCIPKYTVYKYFIIPKNIRLIRLIVEWSPQNDKDQ